MGFVTKEKFLSKDFFITYAWLLGGCFVFALGAVMFAEPYGFAPGGTYGLSMVFHHLWGWETEIAALCMDVPLLLLSEERSTVSEILSVSAIHRSSLEWFRLLQISHRQKQARSLIRLWK